MFAVFYKGEFKNFWLNGMNDQDWVQRTALAMGWELNQIEVRQVLQAPQNSDVFAFDENKDMNFFNAVEVDAEDPQDKNKTIKKTVHKIKEKITLPIYFKDGKKQM